MKILITGGHLTPALACIDFIQKNHPQDEIVFIGRKFSQTNKQLAREEKEISQRNIEFIFLATPKFLSHKAFNLLLQIPKLIKAIFKAKEIIKTHKPDILLSFGGYLSIPVAIAARLSKIPIIIHEQTGSLGLANKIISLFASKVALSQETIGPRPTSLGLEKYVFTGNPIRYSLTQKAKQPSWLKYAQDKPLLYITGGNQGSKAINDLINISLNKLLDNFIVIHQTGNINNPNSNLENYYPKTWVEEAELAWILTHTDLAISRSGANTVQELQYFAVPTLFIPLPTARNNEQLDNAKKIVKLGGALILEQNQANTSNLIKNLNYLLVNKKIMRQKLQTNNPKEILNAAQNIYKLLENEKK